jgi:WhiB family redox-sensing transcriptional regulator
MNWRDAAACVEADPELFFRPELQHGLTRRERHRGREVAAKAYCAVCPVVPECLADALDAGDRDSIRGGLTPDERRKVMAS